MDELDVVERLSAYLERNSYRYFLDSGYSGSRVNELASEFDNCGLNNTITIGRRIPDIIGFSPSNQIIAIEAKGTSDIRKGIGQAAYYRKGVHLSFIAAEENALQEFKQTALSCGIGVVSIPEEAGVDIQEPNQNISAATVSRTRQALGVKTAEFESDQNTFPPMTHPLNALLPVVAIGGYDDEETGLTVERCRQIIEESPQSYNRYDPPVTLAQTLGLVKTVQASVPCIELTEIGKAGYRLLRGLQFDSKHLGDPFEKEWASDDVENLFKMIGRLKRIRSRVLYQITPELAAFLRNRYLSVPDVRVLTDVLASQDNTRAELAHILSEVALTSPDVFLNLFCGLGKEQQFRELVETQPMGDIVDREFKSAILDIASPSYLYNFLYQLRHTKILTEDTEPVHQNDKLELDTFYCAWSRDVVGESRSLV